MKKLTEHNSDIAHSSFQPRERIITALVGLNISIVKEGIVATYEVDAGKIQLTTEGNRVLIHGKRYQNGH